jgi:pilus assembly protein FimV
MALRKRPIAAGISALLFSGYVAALGLGEISLNSALNEPLDAEIPLLNLDELTEDEIIAGLASNKDFANAGVEKGLILTGLKFRLDLSTPTKPVIRVTSQRPIREPYLDFLVDVQWPSGRVLREYTLLLDLPVYAGGTFSKKKSRPQVASRNTWGASAPAPSTSSARTGQAFTAGRGEYQVMAGDTLWGISRRLPGDTSVYDKMTAIQQLNPEAFINNDINLLKKGAVLRLPEFSPGAGGVSGDSGSSYSAPLSGSSRSSAAPAVSDGSGRLSLSATSQTRNQGDLLGGDGSGSVAVRGEIASIQEELDRSRRENGELRQRLSSLENQLGTIQKILELEDDSLRAAQLASLQQGLVQDDGNAPDTVGETNSLQATEEEDSPALALFPSANERRAALGGNQPGAIDSQATESLDGEATVADMAEEGEPSPSGSEGERETAKPVTAPAAMELNRKEGWADKVSSYLSYLLGAVVIAIGLIVFLVLRRKGKSRDYESFEDYSAPVTPAPVSPVRSRPAVVVEEPEAASIDEIDLREEDDLFAPAEEEQTPPPTRYDTGATGSELDSELADVNLDEFDLPETPAEERVSAQPEEELNLDEEFDFLADVDEGDTQLELAQAYLEMGDQGGAREILQEVLEDGSDQQKAKARQMLEQLG